MTRKSKIQLIRQGYIKLGHKIVHKKRDDHKIPFY